MKTGSLRRSGVLWLALAAVAGAAFGQEETALKPIPGLSQEKFGKVEDLRARLREQQRNLMSLPDSAQLIRAAAKGAAYNVQINLSSIKDAVFREHLAKETDELLRRVLKESADLEERVERSLG